MNSRVSLRPNTPPTCVDDFPAKAKRSVKGALHLVPGTFRQVTYDELEHLQKKLGAKLLVLA